MKSERILGGLVSLGMVAAMSAPAILAKSQAAPAQQGRNGNEGQTPSRRGEPEPYG